MEEMLYNEEAGFPFIVTNVKTVFDGMAIDPSIERLIPCHILEIQYFDEHYGIRGKIYFRHFVYYPEPDIISGLIIETETFKLRGRKYTDSEKRIDSLTTKEALTGYIRLYNYNLRKILEMGEMDKRLNRLYHFATREGFHNWDFSRVELE